MAFIVLESLCPARTEANRAKEELVGGISTGMALGIMLFLKISFFLAGVPLLAALSVCRRQDRRRWIGCAIGFGLLFVAVMVYLRFDIGAVWHDLRLTASAKKIPPQRLADVLLPTFGPMLWLIFLSFFASLLRIRGEETFPRHLTFAAVVVAMVNYLVILGNHQDSGLPLGVALSIILLGVICGGRSYPKSDRNLTLYRAVLFIWSAFFFIPPIASDLAGLGYGAIEANRYRRSSVLEFDSPRLKPMLFVGPREFGSSYVTCINEGIHMLRGQPANETIATLSYTNPFPYALGRTPAHGGTTYFWVDYNFSDRMRPPGELMLGDASIVMVPKYWSDGGAVDGFGGYVKRNYNLAQESPCWALYRRK
jgi:multisubunit Na+/H+ antiporter MnhF subunit